MPFTFSHPALVLPLFRLRRRWPWLSATGLIMGSIAPDFEKLLRLRLTNGHSHTVASLVYFSLPVGLALAFLFHELVRQPLLRHLPAPLHRRLASQFYFSWPAFVRRHPLGVLVSIELGAVSHLLWDSFTHQNALLARYLPWLELTTMLPGYHVPVYDLLALLSSVGGGLALAWVVWRQPEQPAGPPPTAAALGRYWGRAALVALGLQGIWVLAAQPDEASTILAAISATLLGVLATSAWAQAPRLTRWLQ